jgi:toxin ParE1/3/4
LIRYAEAVDSDLEAIKSYLQPRAGPIVTDRVLDTILTAIERLDRMPFIGRPGRRAGTREMVITRYPYIVVYRVAGNDVEIARVLHQRMQWPPVA